jgi:hypothetical protein
MFSIDDVEVAAKAKTGRLPQVGECWVRKDGRISKVVAVTDNRFGPLDIREEDGRLSHRTRDGRFAMMGYRGACNEDLMHLMEGEEFVQAVPVPLRGTIS